MGGTSELGHLSPRTHPAPAEGCSWGRGAAVNSPAPLASLLTHQAREQRLSAGDLQGGQGAVGGTSISGNLSTHLV